MLKKTLWVMAGLAFVISAGTQFLIFLGLLLEHQIEFVESDIFINRLEFGIALFILLVALFVFGYFMKKLIRD